MGCCFTRPKTQTQNPHNHKSLKNHKPHSKSSLPISNPTHHEETPPPPPEEESVKEVLSETPISKPHQVPILPLETKTQMPLVKNPDEKLETKVPIEEVTEVLSVSQASETCTVTESFSAATTATVPEKREDEVTSKQCNREATTTHKWNRSPSRKRPLVADGNVTGGNERRVKSPARRSEPSPEKKIKSGSRTVRGRESGVVANRKMNGGNVGVRRDSGEGSGRRSRSPSCSRSGKVGIGGGRKQVPAVENGIEKEKEKKSESEEVGKKNDIVSHGESIENPHVSMECFIFL